MPKGTLITFESYLILLSSKWLNYLSNGITTIRSPLSTILKQIAVIHQIHYISGHQMPIAILLIKYYYLWREDEVVSECMLLRGSLPCQGHQYIRLMGIVRLSLVPCIDFDKAWCLDKTIHANRSNCGFLGSPESSFMLNILKIQRILASDMSSVLCYLFLSFLNLPYLPVTFSGPSHSIY